MRKEKKLLDSVTNGPKHKTVKIMQVISAG